MYVHWTLNSLREWTSWVVVTTLKSDHIQPLVIGLVVKVLLLRNYRFEKNKVGTDETWITLFKFDEMQRNLEDFQERCDEYQTKESGLSLSCVPEVMIKVGIFSNKSMNKETISYVIILQQIDR